MVLKIRAYYFE